MGGNVRVEPYAWALLQHVLMFGDTQMHTCSFGNTSQNNYPKKGSGEGQGRFTQSCGPSAL